MSAEIVFLHSVRSRELAEHGPTIDQLRHLAMAPYDTLSAADASRQADHELLRVCSVALRAIKDSENLSEELYRVGYAKAPSELRDRHKTARRAAADAMHAAGKLSAVTPAGLYAQALLVKHSRSKAPVLGASIARDLLAIPNLGQSLWPSEGCEA